MFKSFILLTISISSFGQFKDSAVGVVYLNSENKEAYSVTIVIPAQMLSESLNDKKTLAFSGSLRLFDAKGELNTIKGPLTFKIHQWCENDGGLQRRPTLDVTIKKTQLIRELKGKKDIQNIACFVIANSLAVERKAVNTVSPKSIVLTGDRNNDGKIDCFISTYYDDAENCTGQPVNHLGINLHVAGVVYSLRCCGP